MPMSELETELKQVMSERAAALGGPPPLRRPSTIRGRGPRFGPRQRVVVVAAVAAILGLAAGVALPQVLGGSVTPVSDRFVVASGETDEGPWRITAYRAQVTGFTRASGDVATGWCLDLDSPVVEDSELPGPGYANSCTVVQEGTEATAEPIGTHTRIPGFDGDGALIYGEVSTAVTSLEIVLEGGDVQQVAVVRGPEAWNLPTAYFATVASGAGEVELVARDQNGEVLDRESM
jgi:hypothetical protein